MELSQLRQRLREIRLRWLLIGSSAAVVWGLVVMVALIMAGVWLDLVWELSPELRIAALAIAVAGAFGLAAILIAVTILAARDVEMARRLDRGGKLGGDILTGWDLRRFTAPMPRPKCRNRPATWPKWRSPTPLGSRIKSPPSKPSARGRSAGR